MVDNLPIDDIKCWEKYHAHNWVYDLSRLLDAQNIKWSPYKTSALNYPMFNMALFVPDTNEYISNHEPGYIYITEPVGDIILTEVYIIKGEIKLMRHIDQITKTEIPNLVGEVELRLNAFVTLYFQKFTGVFCAKTYQNNIYGISLKPLNIPNETNLEVQKLIKKIYKKNEINLAANTQILELSV